MFWCGFIVLMLGLLLTYLKGRVVWRAAHDLYQSGGIPTLDFPFVYPLPIAVGSSLTISALHPLPIAGLGLAVYVVSVVGLGVLMWWFYQVGAAERQRQWEAVQERLAAKQTASPSKAG